MTLLASMIFLDVVETLFANTMRLMVLDFSRAWFLVVCVSFNLFQRSLNSSDDWNELVMERLRGPHRFQASQLQATSRARARSTGPLDQHFASLTLASPTLSWRC